MTNPAPEPIRIYTIPVEGSFECQYCGEYVEKALYIPEDRVLTWKCSNDHKTFIEKINL